MSGEDDEAASLTLAEQLAHKNWKFRLAGYEALAAQPARADSAALSVLLSKGATDANAVAHECALKAIYAVLSAGETLQQQRSLLASSLAEKALSSPRNGTRAKAIDLLLLLIELDNKADGTMDAILPLLDHKTPKLVAATVSAIRECLRQFGSKVVPVKPIVKSMAKLFDHKDGTVRAEATNLAIELYRWLGPAILPSLNELKPVQLKELNDQFEQLENNTRATPERFVRSEIAKREAAGYIEASADAAAETPTAAAADPVDVFDISDPVSILDKLPKDFYEQVNAAKWSERKDALELLLGLSKAPKLEDGRYGELVGMLCKKINDPHIVVFTLAINCLEHLARGLRSNFSQFRSLLIPVLLEKFKEKKPAVIEAVRNTLDAIFLSCGESLGDVLSVEDVITSTKHKNPIVRMETGKFLARCLCSVRKSPSKGDIKTIGGVGVRLIEDGEVGVRDSGVEVCGALWRVCGGEKGLGGCFEGVEKGRLGRIREAAEKTVTRVGGGGASSVGAGSGSLVGKVDGGALKRSVVGVVGGGVRPKAAPAKTSVKKPTSAVSSSTNSSTAAPSTKVKKGTAVVKAEEPVTFKFSDESGAAWMAETFADIDLKEFGDSNWKVRLGACQAFQDKIKDLDAATLEPEAVIRFLGVTPGWKESNFQVMTSMFACCSHLAKHARASKGAINLVLNATAEKLGDAKLKKVAGDCFTTFAETSSLQFVLSTLYDPLSKAKSPKTLADALLWIHASVMEFGISGGLNVKSLVEFLKEFALGNTNASVRGNGVVLLGGLRMFVGPDIRKFVADLSGPQLATIDAEFEKVAARAPPEPTRAVQDSVSAGSEDAIDNLFPRVDISTKVASETFEKLTSAKWGERKEGLEELAAAIEASNKRLKPNLGEVPAALKARLNDSNRNLGIMAVEICGNLAVAVGKPFTRYAQLLLGPMIALLADQKPLVRTAAMNALENVHIACNGVDVFISPAAQSLVADQPNLRKDLLKFIGEKLDLCKANPQQSLPKTEELLKPVLMCLQDKNSDVRKYAAVVLGFVNLDIGTNVILEKAGDWYHGSALASLKPFFDALGSSGGGIAPVSPKPGKAVLQVAADSKSKRISTASGGAKKRNTVSGLSASVEKVTSADKPVSAAAGDSFPVLTFDLRAKETRAGQDRGMTKWTFEAPRKDLIDFLADQCKDNLSESIVALLFSTDHYKEKDFLQGLTLLDQGILSAVNGDAGLRSRYVANSDLILKYLTIRFFDTNTSMLLKVLELLEHLFSLLDMEGITLTDYEAGAFLPFFITKVGDNKETMRVKIRGIFKQLCHIYPPSKLFMNLLNALASKNSRTRTECLEELGDLIKKNGMTVCVPAKVLPMIAAQIADSDAKVRNAALGTVTQAYMLIGDAVYKYLGKISDKDKSLLEEKVKRLPSQPVLTAVAAPMPKPASPLFQKKKPIPSSDNSPETVNNSTVAGMVGIPKSSLSNVVKKEFSLDLDQLNIPTKVEKAPRDSSDSLLLDYLVTQITASDAYQSIDALKQLEKIISGSPDQLVPRIDPIISAVTLQIRISFSASDISNQTTIRLCKHLVNVLVQIFSTPEIAHNIQRTQLYQCVQELLNRLLDPNLQNVEQGAQLAKALNVLMVRVLDNADRNLSFSILLALLEQSATASAHCTSEELPLQAKYTELVMKCLWKMTKVIPQLIQEQHLDASQLILAVHDFLKISPPNEWKRRAAEKVIPQADMPLRTVKTILHELCNSLGDKILDLVSIVPEPNKSHAVGYIRQMLGQSALSGSNAPSPPSNADQKSDSDGKQGGETVDYKKSLNELKRSFTVPVRESMTSLSNESTPSAIQSHVPPSQTIPRRSSQGPLSEMEADSQLTVIFARISAKEETKQGIADLYMFKKLHPDCEVYVNAHLAKTGNYFQGYIKRGLMALENEEKSAPASSLNTSGVQSLIGTDAGVSDAYRETLSRFQQRLQEGADGSAELPSIASQRFSMPVSFSSCKEDAPNSMGRVTSIPPTSRITNENKAPSATTQTVEQLKQRLAAMKMQQMGSANLG